MLRHSNYQSLTPNIESVWQAIKQRNYNEGLFLLLDTEERSDDWFLAKAKCHIGLCEFTNALKSLSHIRRSSKKNVLLTKAQCYEAMGEYDQVVKTYQKIFNWQRDKQTLISLARSYETMGQYDHALATYQKIFNWQHDKQTLISLARCYQGMGRDIDVITTYQMIQYLVSKTDNLNVST